MKVAVHKVTLAVVDHDELGPEEVVRTLENARYPNRCMSPHGMDIETKEVDWHDQHPLNLIHKQAEAFRELFPPNEAGELRAWQKRVVDAVSRITTAVTWGAEVATIIEGWVEEKLRRTKDPIQRFHNLCQGLEEHADESPYDRKAWDEMDEEHKRLLKAAKETRELVDGALKEGLIGQHHDGHYILQLSPEKYDAFCVAAGRKPKTIGEETGESCSGCGRPNTWHPDCPDCEAATKKERP